MRLIEFDLVPSLALLDSSTSGMALWVKLPPHLIPEAVKVYKEENNIHLEFKYLENRRIKELQIAEGIKAYVCDYCLPCIVGFSLPAKKFQSRMFEILMWIGKEIHNINSEPLKNNYRIIYSLLQTHDVLIPAQ